jgi:CheY-like chemotaxis protein
MTSGENTEAGLGIGLALVKRLIVLHGGSIEVASEGNGRGSTFTVRLPVETAPETAGQRGSQDSEKPPMTPLRRKILVVDDNRDSADSLAMVLDMGGHEVKVAYDGEAAVSEYRAFHPDWVILDIGMPKIDGYEAAKRIRGSAFGETVRLIALTGWGQESDKNRALAAGFDHHFTKPIDLERLNALIVSPA